MVKLLHTLSLSSPSILKTRVGPPTNSPIPPTVKRAVVMDTLPSSSIPPRKITIMDMIILPKLPVNIARNAHIVRVRSLVSSVMLVSLPPPPGSLRPSA